VLETSRLWRDVTSRVLAKEFPDVALEHVLVDAASMHLIQNPARFDVIVTENMFGDILTDEASVLCGSLGLIPSASLGDGTKGLYEPIHGSAPDIAGRGVANPIGMILSAALMLRSSLGLAEAADAIETAVEATLDHGIVTADLGGSAGTRDVAVAVIERLGAATTIAELILSLVARRPGLTEAQIAEELFAGQGYQQRVNSDCTLLVRRGKLQRSGAGGAADPFRYHPAGKR
jgi:3-isopropylmalate dehydrogenase